MRKVKLKESFFKRNYKKILRLILAIYLVSVGALIQIIWSTPYFGMIQTEEAIGGVFNYEGDDLSNKIANSFAYGEVEFFYNEWIETDGTSTTPTLINIPSRWTGMEYRGEKLPRKGYASYRFYLRGIPKGSIIRIWLDNDTAYRLYYNHELVGQVGEVYKDRVTTNYNKNFNQLYTVTTDEIEVVVEVGYQMAGGIIILPFFSSIDRGENAYTNFIASFIYMAIGLSFILLIFCIVFDISIPNSRITLIMLGIIFFFFTSFDIVYVLRNFNINVSVRIFELIHFFSLSLLFIIIYNYLINKTNKSNYKYFWIYILLNVFNYVLYVFLYGTKLLFIPFILLFIIQTIFYIVFFKKHEIIYPFKLLLIVLMSLMFAIMLDFCDMIVYSLWSIYSFYMFVIYGIVIYLIIKKFIEYGNYNRTIEFLKYQSDCARLDLHAEKNFLEFLSNGITDETLNNKILDYRKYLNVKNQYVYKKFVKFDKEIEFSKLYVKSGINFNFKLIEEIEYSDFIVPSFIIQPIIENAVKHGGIKNEHHFVKIKSEYKNDKIIITILNNGLPFNMKKVDERMGVGINNVIERLRYLYSECDISFKSDNYQAVIIKINPKSIRNLDQITVEEN